MFVETNDKIVLNYSTSNTIFWWYNVIFVSIEFEALKGDDINIIATNDYAYGTNYNIKGILHIVRRYYNRTTLIRIILKYYWN